MKTLRVGIIGQGRSGRDIHAEYLTKDPQRYQIVAVVDPIGDRRRRAAAELHCEVYADHHELLKRRDLDLVINATPSHLHVPVTLDILAAGIHVLCEKPLAKRLADVDAMIAAANKAGRVLAIYQQSRFAPYFQQVRKVIDSGVLGRIIQISVAFNGFARRWDWQTLTEMDGGNLMNTGPHPLDQALVLFGDATPNVHCLMDRVNTAGNAEDYVKLILSGPGRPVIDLEISSCCAYPNFTYHVQGSCGGLKGNTSHIEWRYIVPAEHPPLQLHREPIANPDGTPAYCGEKLQWHTDSWQAPPDAAPDATKIASKPPAYMSAQFYAMLYRALAEGQPLEITPQQVRRQIAVIEQCHRQNPQIYPVAGTTGALGPREPGAKGKLQTAGA